MKKVLFVLLAVFALGAQAKEYEYRVVEGDPIQARIYTLDNGLTVYLSQNQEKPEIQTFIAVRAGAQNDPLESTGLAHYQEHIMFKGTKSYGTTNYEAELPNLNAIDSLYEVYGATTDPEARKAIYHLIDSFSYENSKIAVANEFDKLMNAIGATGVNAFTSTEMTCYHEVIPSGELTRWAMIESDRFMNLVVRGFHTELETVYEEFNMYSTMDQDKVMLAIDQLLFPNIPYRQHSVIGTQEDLKNPSLKNIKQFYKTYYRPNNVAVCLAGDFEFDHAIETIDKYFGGWEASEIPAFVQPEQADLTAHKDTLVYGKESPQVWLAWKLPNIRHEDCDALEIMSSVMSNGKCGLIDLDIDQKQTLLDAEDYFQEGNDFSTYYLIGSPKEKQSLDEVRDILLAEVDKLKKGEFSEELLQAIIRNKKRNDLISQQNNVNRTYQFVMAHIYQIPYEDVVGTLERMEKITKDDIVRVANKYLKDNYVCVFKHPGDNGVNPEKVEKPAITPIEMNRDAQSEFCSNLLQMESDKLTPQFLDFDKDLSRSVLPNGVELLYVQNKENDLAQLNFVIGKGSDQEPMLDFSTTLLQYLGTEEFSAEEYQTQLYSLAAEAWAYANDNETELGVYGLQETLPEALALMENWVLTAQPDDEILKEIIRDEIKSHNDSKSDQQSCFRHLMRYGLIGPKALQARLYTPKQMKKLKAQMVLDRLRAILPAIERVEYFGPMSEDEVIELLMKSNLMALADASKREEAKRIQNEVVKAPEVLLAPYDANNIYLVGYANWGEVYNPKDEAIINLFNEYFDGSMGSIVFQEMRESRALCYSAGASFITPSYKGDKNYFFTFILSQNDKMADCVNAFDSICNVLPLSQAAFDNAKTALLKRIEKRRYVRMAPINYYVSYREAGWDHDYWEDIYREAQKLTLDDVVAFQKAHVANRTYRYMILGNEKELDMDFLKKCGTIKKLSIKDIFVY
ncbi:MAG: insulinase family protein [Paludibacteraceae bacterium]|nr:insulinase family protein [Paludibacteraceae bacterium]